MTNNNIYKIQLKDSTINKIDIPASCNQLQIFGQVFEQDSSSYYRGRNKLWTYNLTTILQKNRIEILDMRHCENVETISCDFENLLYLKIILLPKSLKEMPRFKNCPNLSYVSAESVESIADYCFENCPNLTDIKLGDNLKHIHSGAFAGTGITHISLPNNKTVIYDGAFAGCSALCSISLPDDIEELTHRVFEGCANLTKVEGGKSIKRISKSTFKGCVKLRYLNFNASFIDSDFLKLNKGSWDKNNESSSTISQGIVLLKINNNIIIWDVEKHKFYSGEADCLVGELIEFAIIDDVNALYIDEYVILDRTHRITDISIINEEQIERMTKSFPQNIKYQTMSDYQKKYQAMLFFKKRTFEAFRPFRVFINNTIDYVGAINIDDVINSYKTEISEHIKTKIGGDDSYYRHTVRKAIIQDSYIDKILPPLNEEFTERGYCRFYRMSDKDKALIDAQDEKTKENAREIYNKENHIDDIIDDHIQSLINANVCIEEIFQLSKAKSLLNKLLSTTVLVGKFYTKKSIADVYTPDVIVEKLNNML